ncbi:MAG: class I SAM-dependent methyltransferase [Phycisphaerales bacterium]
MTHPATSARLLRDTYRAARFADSLPSSQVEPRPSEAASSNPLRAFFEANRSGPGIWKWTHYFDAYHRHLAKFIGQEVHILEVGIYSGGSLRMWRDYFGDRCRVYGVDIEPACRRYEDDHTRVFIGDQADRSFWARVRRDVPTLDIVIDDGGHQPEQQIVTLEETLSHLAPGGVFMCEDVHGSTNAFLSYVHGLTSGLYHFAAKREADGGASSDASRLQAHIASIHHYPYLVVLERRAEQITRLTAPKHGTEWQPFL